MAARRRTNYSDAPSVQVRAADPDLIRSVYAEHGAALLGYVSRLLDGDRQQAEDIVQETLLRAWRHPEALDVDRGDVRPWLWTVARRLLIDRSRARRARPAEVRERDLGAFPAGDELAEALQAWQVADALRSLTAAHRAVLVQTYYLGRTVAEAAEVLGVPAGTVKSRASYALRELRLVLMAQGITG
jgi:RNA polymerase sigma-70 factor, ECF subfamily